MENMNELYSDIILEHNQSQANKRLLDVANISEHGHNPSCGDDITLQPTFRTASSKMLPIRATAVPSARLRRIS